MTIEADHQTEAWLTPEAAAAIAEASVAGGQGMVALFRRARFGQIAFRSISLRYWSGNASDAADLSQCISAQDHAGLAMMFQLLEDDTISDDNSFKTVCHRSGDYELQQVGSRPGGPEYAVVGLKFSEKDVRTCFEDNPIIGDVTAVPKSSSRNKALEHNHPFAAASAALKLRILDDTQYARLTITSIASDMKTFYQESHQEGRSPAEESIEIHAKEVKRALDNHRSGTSKCK